ncbi:MAG TPA: hypothetical protein VGR00_13130 [Thermoanaerobaculia bacterium]|nr:hypothetical protein [Thermoanaerobaculia bacterium]
MSRRNLLARAHDRSRQRPYTACAGTESGWPGWRLQMRGNPVLRFFGVSLLLAVLGFAPAVHAGQVTVGSATGSPGGTVRIPLTYSTAGEPLLSVGVVIQTPDTLTFVSAEPGPITSVAGRMFTSGGGNGIFFVQLTPQAQAGFDSAIPDGLLATVTLSVAAGASGTLALTAYEGANLGNRYPDGAVVTVNVIPGSVAVSCSAPGAPSFLSAPATLQAGQSYAAKWSPAQGLGGDGAYVLETSTDPSFATVASTLTTRDTNALVPTAVSGQDATLSLRVRGVQCGASGPNSAPVALTVRGLAETFIATTSNLALRGTVGGTSNTGVAGFRNVGGKSGALSLAVSDGSFDVSPSSLTLAPGSDATVSVTARASALTKPAIVQGSLIATFGSKTIRLPITLSVAPAGGSHGGTKIRATPLTVQFAAPAGQNPPPATVKLTISPAGNGPLYLSAAIGPGGSWLVPPPELASPVPSGNEFTLTLAVNRANRSTLDGIAPLTTLLTLTPVGGDDADAIGIQVQDVETPAVGTGSDRGSAPPEGTSFIVPSSVKAQGAGDSVFTSDGWLKNQSSASVSADFYFTPDGVSGLTDSGVRKTRQTIPAGATLRLADLVSSIFQGSGVSGQVEVRTAAPGSLSLRTSVEAVTGGEASSRYGTEMPVVAFGAGIGKDQGELVLPGVDDDADRRANLILTETTGAAATVKIAVIDSNGQTRGETTKDVPPYGKVQINRLVQTVLGSGLTGGSAAVSVTVGAGRVVPVATIIDNRSNSFSAVRGQAARATLPPGRRPLATNPASLILPSAARLTGAANTHFTTRVSMVNGTAQPATLTMTYHYVDVEDGSKQKSVSKPVILPPRGTLPPAVGDDIVANLFGLTGATFGWMEATGDVARVVATTAVSAQVDPNDSSKGVKTAQVGGLLSDSSDVMALNEVEHRFAGLEKSLQRRTNLALVETLGQPARVVVRMYDTNGVKLAERAYDVAPAQYLQITDVFGFNGVDLGDGPFQNVELTAQVTSGAGRVVGVASVNDNVSRNPELFVLKGAGPPPPSIGF